MIKNGTWKSEPANEDGWNVDWSIAEPDPEFIEREAFNAHFGCEDRYAFNGEGL